MLLLPPGLVAVVAGEGDLHAEVQELAEKGLGLFETAGDPEPSRSGGARRSIEATSLFGTCRSIPSWVTASPPVSVIA